MKHTKNPWKTVSSKYVYENPYLKIREDNVVRPNGEDGFYGVVEINPSVIVIAERHDKHIALIGQWRYVHKHYSVELPAGGGDGEKLQEAAKRELQEETGLTADTWTQIGSCVPLNGIVTEVSNIFLAQKLHETKKHSKQEEGIEEIRWVSLAEAEDLIRKGEIKDGQTVSAIYFYRLYRESHS